MRKMYTAAELARHLGGQFGVALLPRRISDAIYQGALDEKKCPLIGDRRMIPESYVPKVEAVLRERGFLPATASAESAAV